MNRFELSRRDLLYSAGVAAVGVGTASLASGETSRGTVAKDRPQATGSPRTFPEGFY